MLAAVSAFCSAPAISSWRRNLRSHRIYGRTQGLGPSASRAEGGWWTGQIVVGVLITMQEPTAEMRRETAAAGFYRLLQTCRER